MADCNSRGCYQPDTAGKYGPYVPNSGDRFGDFLFSLTPFGMIEAAAECSNGDELSCVGAVPLPPIRALRGLRALDDAGDAAKTAGSGADNVVNGVRLRAQLTGKEISGGHAFQKHVVQGGEFPGITTRGQFAAKIESVVTNGEMRPLSGGRSAYWHDGVVVIRNPGAADGGTAFVPKHGYDYFLNSLH